ncbi:DEAD/DEAH box helicase family protein [Lysinibacillus boronitolerans]|uniref:DEAD/DEAH box helicase n=1 Tax=Lysinibacillus boronitolerans TaxID=309788 RepID=UPI002163AD75|nr:DEAD/DEAH box helicase [Lysinibacillus boronitolerans]MCS1393890.1 DEAD/DEAH box helicase family protein [Lysinibacillus boronitolerans]
MKGENVMRYRGWLLPPALRDFHEGRIWLKDHSPFSSVDLEKAIQRKYVSIIEGIQMKPAIKCNRCHNTDPHLFTLFDCSKCQQQCVYCRHCIKMGRVSSCTQLMIWTGPKAIKINKHSLKWAGQYTELQQQAANETLASVKAKRSHLIHAVCGAGKTELLFPSVYDALKRGLRVCIATPRTDVVLELYPRFQQAFPETTIHALYGGAPYQNGYAQLVIATTHQLYRFEKAFDVIIVDEADAFPYTFDETLQRAVEKAKKEKAPLVFVTATPSAALRHTFQQESYSFIPKRYHNHPLPVPQVRSLWGYEKCFKRGKIPKRLKKWVEERLHQKDPFLLFFPTIDLMKRATPLVQELNEDILAVHAADPERKEKVLKLRNKEVPGLLTTTILERGITISKVQVAVIGAESLIFTANALIQIAGRVGRDVQFPDGEVLFFHHGITAEMDEACAKIQFYNKKGFSE